MKKHSEATFYVATNGNDRWSGRLPEPNAMGTDGPFITIHAARDAVRQMKEKEGLKQPITIMVRGGKYFLEHTLILSAADSGTRECPITYTAYPEEKPILSGGRKITGWKPYKGKILQCDVPKSKGGKWKFRQLFFNGERQIRARYPNFDPENPIYGGWAFMEGPAEEGSSLAFKYKPGTFKRRWEKPTEAEVFVFIQKYGNSILPIEQVDWDKNIITVAHGGRAFDIMPYFRSVAFGDNDRFVVENVLEELDQEGEWCLDTEEGKLYFWPPTDSIEDGEVVAPTLDCLVDLCGSNKRSENRGSQWLSGDLGGPEWVTISGFTFTETQSGDDYHRPGVEGGGPTGSVCVPGQTYSGDALHMRGALHCRIENNHFYSVGGNAIYLEHYNERNVIQYNEIGYSGANGICLVGSKYFHTVPRHPIYNRVEDNYIHHCGFFNKYVNGVFLGISQGNVIGHNLIEYMPHIGINLGQEGFGRNIVEYNKIRSTAQEISDVAAIYSSMEDPGGQTEKVGQKAGHLIRYNLISDTSGCEVTDEGTLVPAPDKTFAIYLDNFSDNCFVYGNIILRPGFGITVNMGRNNVIENNIIVDGKGCLRYCAYHSFAPHMYGSAVNNRFCKNIYYRLRSEGDLYHLIDGKGELPIDRMIQQSDYNVFFDTKDEPYTINISSAGAEEFSRGAGNALTLTEWQKSGFEEHSVVADPLFIDPENDDFRLNSNSPALKLGFQPIDTQNIGIRSKDQK